MMNYTLITGACGGLGNEFVKLCAENNENLLLIGTNNKKLEELVIKFSELFQNIKVITFVCDLSQSESIDNLYKFIKEKKIKINKLINNAGIIIEGDIEKFSDADILKAVQVNCLGTLDLTQKILKNKKTEDKLEILTVSSLAYAYPIPHMGVYAATKSFLTSMMLSLSYEYKDKNVVISTLCPSGIATTQAMKESIKSMGLSGKLTTLSASKIAKIALKGLKKRKKIIVPGFFNKMVLFFSRFFSVVFLAKITDKIWKKSQKKRGF